MENNDVVINNIASNIAYYRKKMNLTQLELAEKLNYSDKTISKWERGEGIPSVVVLKEIVDFFGITLNDIISEKKVKTINKEKKRTLYAYFYSTIPFVLAIIIYGVLKMIDIDLSAWKIIIYAIPAFSIILFVFSIIWKKKHLVYFYLTIFIWTLALSIFLTVSFKNKYMIFIIAIPIYFFSMFLMKVIQISKK